MIALVATTQKLELVLAGAPSANQPKINVVFVDENKEGQDTKYSMQQSTANSSTDVTICSAPQQSFVRCIESVFIYNRDTASVVATVKLDDGGTEYEIVKQTVPTLRTLCYEHGNGWYIV